tara:strand:+ start:202 stop:591 length:390 start_codon:yes stop_codon:yes gene_type:complete
MNLLNNISYFIIVNGIYDIISALTILNYLKIPSIKTLRLSLITKNTEPESLLERFIGYSILANGIIRIMNGMTLHEQSSQVIVAGTYFLEAFIMANEYYYYKSVDFQKSMFLICFSLYLGYLSIINYFN